MKQVILDTETTGLDIQSGNRVIEIGCVEIIDRKFTGREFHTFLNPERAVAVSYTHLTLPTKWIV